MKVWRTIITTCRYYVNARISLGFGELNSSLVSRLPLLIQEAGLLDKNGIPFRSFRITQPKFLKVERENIIAIIFVSKM